MEFFSYSKAYLILMNFLLAWLKIFRIILLCYSVRFAKFEKKKDIEWKWKLINLNIKYDYVKQWHILVQCNIVDSPAYVNTEYVIYNECMYIVHIYVIWKNEQTLQIFANIYIVGINFNLFNKTSGIW